MALAVGVLTGVLTGLISSATFWSWQARVTRPRVTLCPTIARYKPSQGTVARCNFKIINQGRRPAMDVKITVIARLPGLVSKDSTQLIKLRDLEISWLGGHQYRRFTVNPGLMPHDTSTDMSIRNFPEWLRRAIAKRADVDLADLFETFPAAILLIDLSALDSLSGARMHARFQYSLEDVKAGKFEDGLSCTHSGIFNQTESIESRNSKHRLVYRGSEGDSSRSGKLGDAVRSGGISDSRQPKAQRPRHWWLPLRHDPP
jgi:hypothetical protein